METVRIASAKSAFRGNGTSKLMKVIVPGPLRSYTSDRSEVGASGATLSAVLDDLDRQFPGMRFRMIDEQDRIREHVRLFVNGELAQDLGVTTKPDDQVQIICAISGGNDWASNSVQ